MTIYYQTILFLNSEMLLYPSNGYSELQLPLQEELLSQMYDMDS